MFQAVGGNRGNRDELSSLNYRSQRKSSDVWDAHRSVYMHLFQFFRNGRRGLRLYQWTSELLFLRKYIATGNCWDIPTEILWRYTQFRSCKRAKNGGGGIRTPVPRCFKTSFYMLSRSIGNSPCQTPNDRLPTQLARNAISPPRRGQPGWPACCLTPLLSPQAKPSRTGCSVLGSHTQLIVAV